MSTNGGGSYTFIKSNPTVDGGNQTSWSIPAVCTAQGKINITDASNEAVVFDESDGLFNLTERFGVTQPTNGTVLVANSTYDIKWTRLSSSALAQVQLWFYNGSAYSLIGNVSNAAGEYLNWPVPADVISTGCKVKVANPYDSANYAESDNPFGIRGDVVVTSPTSGSEIWKSGSMYPITWTYVGPIPNVKISYSTNGTSGPFNTLPFACPQE